MCEISIKVKGFQTTKNIQLLYPNISACDSLNVKFRVSNYTFQFCYWNQLQGEFYFSSLGKWDVFQAHII